MKLIIDIPQTQYNNILEIKSMNLGRIPYKGIVMNAIREIQNGTPIPDNAVTWVDFEHLRDKIIRLSCRYSISRERGCGGQVEWSDRLIKQDDVLKAFEEYQKGSKK